MTFYLCTTARRKNGKRHIVMKYDTEEKAVRAAEGINRKRYKVEVCSGDWKYINHIG